MIVRLGLNKHFTGEYYKVRFVDGLSIDYVSPYTFDLLEKVLGLEPHVISDGCPKCAQKDDEIFELTQKLSKKK
jgi:hypothetical protein